MRHLFMVIFFVATSIVSMAQIPTSFHVEALNDLLGRSTSAERRIFKLLDGTKMYAFLMGTEYYFDLRDISCLADIHVEARYGQVVFYTNNHVYSIKSIYQGEVKYVGAAVIPYVNNDKMLQIVSQISRIFESLKIPVPSKECVWYSNDAEYFQTYAVKILNGDGISPNTIWGTNSLKTGYFTFKYPNDKVRCRRNLKNGICEGEQMDYYEDGKIQFAASYASGLLNGECAFYYFNGQMGSRSYYKNGKREGLHETWNIKGQKESEQLYVNDEIKTQKMWNEDGTILSDDTF